MMDRKLCLAALLLLASAAAARPVGKALLQSEGCTTLPLGYNVLMRTGEGIDGNTVRAGLAWRHEGEGGLFGLTRTRPPERL